MTTTNNQEIIARDTVGGTVYEYRVVQISAGDVAYEVQMRFRGGSWESAYMGRYPTEQEALALFVSRYKILDLATLEPLHPIIHAAKERRLAEKHQEELDAKAEREAEEAMRAKYQAHKDAILANVKAAKFKRDSFTPTTTEGTPLPEIKGLSYGGLIIHTEDVGNWKRWHISHQASGYAVGPRRGFESQTLARTFVVRMIKLFDFSLPIDQIIKSGPKDAIQALWADPYAILGDGTLQKTTQVQ